MGGGLSYLSSALRGWATSSVFPFQQRRQGGERLVRDLGGYHCGCHTTCPACGKGRQMFLIFLVFIVMAIEAQEFPITPIGWVVIVIHILVMNRQFP